MSRITSSGRYGCDVSESEEEESYDDQSSISAPSVRGDQRDINRPIQQQPLFPPLPRQLLRYEDEKSDTSQPAIIIPPTQHLNLSDQGTQEKIDQPPAQELPEPQVSLNQSFKIEFSSSGDFYLPTTSSQLMQFKLKCELQNYKDALVIMNQLEEDEYDTDKLMKLLTRHFDGVNSDMCMVWSLMSILFGDGQLNCCKVLGNSIEMDEWVKKSDSYGTEDMKSIRRKSLYSWLRYWVNYNQPLQKCKGQEEYILEHLTRLNPEKAVAAAQAANYHYLAAMIAAGDSTRELFQSQLEYVKKSGMERSISHVYDILGGNPGILKGLPWKRALGMIIQHFEHKSINSVFSFYSKYVPGTEKNSKDKLDVCFVLIKLYAEARETIPQLRKLLHPYSVGNTHSVGFSWIIYFILTRIFHKNHAFSHIYENLQSRNDCERALNSLGTSGLLFSQELELSGYWEWAVYVLQSLDDSEQLIKDVLARHVTYQTQVQNNMLIHRLNVPKSWVYNAISISCEYYLMHIEALQYSMEVSNIERVHSILIKDIAPLCIVAYPGPEIYDELYEKCIKPLERSKIDIPSWNQAEEVYIKYLDIKKKTEDGSLNITCLAKELMPLLDELPFYTDNQQAAVQFMKYNLVKWNCDALETKLKLGNHIDLNQEIVLCDGLPSFNKVQVAERIAGLYLQSRGSL